MTGLLKGVVIALFCIQWCGAQNDCVDDCPSGMVCVGASCVEETEPNCPDDFAGCTGEILPPDPPLDCGLFVSSVPTCGCEHQCNKKFNEVCGPVTGNCRAGLTCQGDGVLLGLEVTGICVNADTRSQGICPDGTVPCLDGTIARDTSMGSCPFGSRLPECGCQFKCRVEEGDPCGPFEGQCAHGLICFGGGLNITENGHEEILGECIPQDTRVQGFCPDNTVPCEGGFPQRNFSLDCDGQDYSLPRCSCEFNCEKERGDTCGPFEGNCEENNVCNGSGMENGEEVLGVCLKEDKRVQGDCPPDTVPCVTGIFPLDESADCKGLGKAIPMCDCQYKCIKAKGEPCGPIEGQCDGVEDLVCVGSSLTGTPGNLDETLGTCVKEDLRSAAACPTDDVPCSTGAPELDPSLDCGTMNASLPPCSCEFKCMRAQGENCGDAEAECADGLVCHGDVLGVTFRILGTCVPEDLRPQGSCPSNTVPCSDGVAPLDGSLNCGTNGHSLPMCGCEHKCIRDEGEMCGDREGECATGLVCHGDSFNDFGEVTGVCVPEDLRPQGTCPSGTVPCPDGVAPFDSLQCGERNYSLPACSCEFKCIQHEGEPCGEILGDCADGLVCHGDSLTETMDSFNEATGICVPVDNRPQGTCPPDTVPCPDGVAPLDGSLNCKKSGHTLPPCSCEHKCVKEEGEDCGEIEGECADGFVCNGDALKQILSSFEEILGICVPEDIRMQGDCPANTVPCVDGIAPFDAVTASCAEQNSSLPACGCQHTCKKAEGEECGAMAGDCLDGLVCHGDSLDICGCGHEETRGICVPEDDRSQGMCPSGTVPCLDGVPPEPDTLAASCDNLGTSLPDCGCEWACNRGRGETCGPETTDCADGLVCTEVLFPGVGRLETFSINICLEERCRSPLFRRPRFVRSRRPRNRFLSFFNRLNPFRRG